MSFIDRLPSTSRQSRFSVRTRSHSIHSTRSTMYGIGKPLPDYDRCLDQYSPANITPRLFKDQVDFSVSPSYTDFKVPYHIQTEKRYAQSKADMEHQFQTEFKQLLDSMESAYEAARFVRHMCVTTFWPPLHNRAEIIGTQRKFFKLSKKQQKRLDYLMITKII